MNSQSHYAFLIRSVNLLAGDEIKMPQIDERVKNYFEARIASLEEALEAPDTIGVEHLRSAHNLIYHLSSVYDDVHASNEEAIVLRRAALLDLRDELDAKASRLEARLGRY